MSTLTITWVMGVHLLTQHAPDCQPGLKTFTPGAYLVAPSGLTAGAFRNSFGHLTMYAGQTVPVGAGFHVTLGVMGYSKRLIRHQKDTRMHAVPLVAPSYSINANWRLSYLPRARNGPDALHLSWETSL